MPKKLVVPGAVRGWYPEPAGSGTRRYWDGTRWSSSTTSVKPAGRSRLSRIIVGLVVFAALVGIVMFLRNPPGYRLLDGYYDVGSDIEPGAWETRGAIPYTTGGGVCIFQRFSDPLTRPGSSLQAGGGSVGQEVRVFIQPTDKVFYTSGCEKWQDNQPIPDSVHCRTVPP